MLKYDKKCSGPKSKIPVPIVRQKPIVTLAKLEKNKNMIDRLYSSTCSRRAQEEENFKKRSMRKSFEKSASFQKPQSLRLKDDLEKLRRKTAKDASIIKKQQDEITKLKQLIISVKQKQESIQLQAEIKKELAEKRKLQCRLKSMATEKQKLNTRLVDLLEVKSVPKNKDSDQLQQLRAKIQKNKDEFQLKVKEYEQLLKEKEHFIQEQQTKKEQLLEQHQDQIRQIHQDFSARVNLLESQQHEKIPQKKPKMNQAMIDQLVEQVLKDFEQEQHHHPQERVPPVNTITLKSGRQHNYPVNQQWYAQKYIPLNAMTWPSPPALKNTATI